MLSQSSVLISLIATIIIHQNFIEAMVDTKKGKSRNYCLYLFSLIHSIISCIIYGYLLSHRDNISTFRPFDNVDYLSWGIHAGYFISDLYEMLKCKNWGFVIHHLMGLYFLWALLMNNYGGLLMYSMLNAESSAILINLRYLYFKQFNSSLPYLIDSFFWATYIIIRLLFSVITLLILVPQLQFNYYDCVFTGCAISYLLMSGGWARQWLTKIKLSNKKNN